MDTTDKNIKKIFSTYTKNFDIDLEESIMDKINVEKNYNAELSQSRKRIKIGMILSTLFLMIYFVLTYFDTLPRITERMETIDVYLPTIFAALIILVMYLLSTYSLSSSKNKLML